MHAWRRCHAPQQRHVRAHSSFSRPILGLQACRVRLALARRQEQARLPSCCQQRHGRHRLPKQVRQLRQLRSLQRHMAHGPHLQHHLQLLLPAITQPLYLRAATAEHSLAGAESSPSPLRGRSCTCSVMAALVPPFLPVGLIVQLLSGSAAAVSCSSASLPRWLELNLTRWLLLS